MRAARIVTVALLVAACRGSEVTVIPAGDLPADVFASPPPTPSPPTEAQLPAVGTVYLVEEGRLVRTTRSLSQASTLSEALMTALLEPPAEGARRSAIPAATRLIEVEVTGGVATINLSQEFEQGGAGRSLALRVAQVVYTLTEDQRVQAVLFTIEGSPIPVVGASENLIGRPVTRDDYAEFLPH